MRLLHGGTMDTCHGKIWAYNFWGNENSINKGAGNVLEFAKPGTMMEAAAFYSDKGTSKTRGFMCKMTLWLYNEL